MSGLVMILMIFWLASAFTSGSKKNKQKAKQKGGAPRAAAQPKPKPAPKQAAAKPAAAAKVDPLWSRRDAQQTGMPLSKEEWKAYINEMSEGLASKQSSPKPAARVHNDHPGEGSFSTQGESAEEHAAHRRRIEAEEAQLRQERDALDDLRTANRDKLRAAVVMSEVLGKPLALRPRTGYHR